MYKAINKSIFSLWSEYNPNLDPTMPNSFATAVFRLGHSKVKDIFKDTDYAYKHTRTYPLVEVSS